MKKISRSHPILTSLAVLAIVIIVTEPPVNPLRVWFASITGRFYGDYLADMLLNGLGSIMLVVSAGIFGLRGKLGLNKPGSWKSVLLVWPLVLLAILDGSDSLTANLGLVFDPFLLLIFIPLYFFIGFFEEILFRGAIQGMIMRRWGKNPRGIFLSVLVANLIFGGAHLLNLVMGRATAMYAVGQFLFAFFFGIFFSALYLRTGSLWPGIGLHMIYDFIANLDAFTPDAIPRSEIVRDTSPEGLVIGLIITLPLLISGLIYLRTSKLDKIIADPLSVLVDA